MLRMVFANYREGVVADLAVGDKVIGTDQIAVVYIRFGHEFAISMVRVDSSAMSSSSSFDISM